eukprot:gene52711-70469_t
MGDHRHMVRRLVAPAAGRFDNFGAARLRGDIGGRPDVVETAAAVGGLPVGGSVAPPGIGFGAVGNMAADEVGPAVIAAQELVERL